MKLCHVYLLLLLAMLAGRMESATPATPAEFVPAWAKSAIWYQIFPERFRDGDPANNPKVEDILGADPLGRPKVWQVHPWGSDWFELQPYETQNGEPELWKHLQRRRYGGDLQGILDELPYLKKLGVTALYRNPVFAAPSAHKYDGASYHHIDPNFGPDPAGDRAMIARENALDPATWVWTQADELALRLIDAVHAAGMKIMFDGVFNHMGVNSFAFRDLVKNQQASPYRDWFTVKSWDDPAMGTKFRYMGWFDVPSLPELRRDESGLAPGPRDYIYAATRRWMNPKNRGSEHGIDGWRLDVAFCVPHAFWQGWRQEVRRLNPEAYVTAELFLPPEQVAPYVQGDEFDGEMNYNFAFTCTEFFFDRPPRQLRPTEFDRKLRQLRDLYPPGVAAVSLNLIDSHDTNRVGSLILNRHIGGNRDNATYYEKSKASTNPAYNPRRPGEAEIARQKYFVIFQMTYVGAPMVYYGDEVGMWGGNDPDCRKPMLWSDRSYADEVYAADARTRHAPDKVEIRRDLLAHYQRMIAIRRRHEALRLGDYRTVVADDAREVLAFERRTARDRVMVVLNNSLQPLAQELTDLPAAGYVDEVSGRKFATDHGRLRIEIPAQWGVVLTEGAL